MRVQAERYALSVRSGLHGHRLSHICVTSKFLATVGVLNVVKPKECASNLDSKLSCGGRHEAKAVPQMPTYVDH